MAAPNRVQFTPIPDVVIVRRWGHSSYRLRFPVFPGAIAQWVATERYILEPLLLGCLPLNLAVAPTRYVTSYIPLRTEPRHLAVRLREPMRTMRLAWRFTFV